MIKEKEIFRRLILIFLVLIILLFLISFFSLKQVQPIGKRTITSLDNIAPSVSVTFPNEYYETNNAKLLIKGIASDNINVKEVRIKLNNNDWEKALGTNSWSKNLNLIYGENVIYVQVFDSNDNVSPVASRTINYK